MAKQRNKPQANGNGSKCPITREQFEEHSKPLAVSIQGQSLVADVKEFSSGSLGWYSSGKLVIEIDGVPCKVQTQVSMQVVGSKDL